MAHDSLNIEPTSSDELTVTATDSQQLIDLYEALAFYVQANRVDGGSGVSVKFTLDSQKSDRGEEMLVIGGNISDALSALVFFKYINNGTKENLLEVAAKITLRSCLCC